MLAEKISGTNGRVSQRRMLSMTADWFETFLDVYGSVDAVIAGDVERQAAEVRLRVIERARRELDRLDDELSKALGANEPQEYLVRMDWN